MLKSSKAYGGSTVGKDHHFSAVVTRDILTLSGITYVFISIFWFGSSNVYVPVWLNVMWMMSVSMGTSLVSRLL